MYGIRLNGMIVSYEFETLDAAEMEAARYRKAGFRSVEIVRK
jgi:hypothetical protein